jgi:hypothetical protein
MRHLFVHLAIVAVFWAGIGSAVSAGAPDPLDIPYSSLEEATAALRAKQGVTFRDQDGWIVAQDLDAFTTWLLTPAKHPAYPSIVRRTLVNSKDGASMETRIRCFASKETCDKYFGGR